MKVVFLAPAYPPEMQQYTRGLAEVGASVYGVGDAPVASLPRSLKQHLTDYLQVPRLLDEADVTERVYQWVRGRGVDRVLANWEVMVLTAARLRERLGVPGMSYDAVRGFRDKQLMKDELRRHGLPCARHKLIRTWGDAEAFVAEVGLPLVLKPPAGMGCKSTWRIGSLDELRAALRALHASPERPALAEEFLRGREYSFETITIGGQVRFQSCSRYYPTPLEVMETPWIQWVVVLPRDIDGPEFADARALGVKAVAALGLETGFTHMEWFRRDDGSLAIGEIAARPPGAHIVLANGYAHDADLYRAWARAVIDDAFDGPWTRKYAVGVAYLRGVGRGRVKAVRGVDRANALVGHLAVESRLPTIGAPRSDSYEGDGYVVVRDPDVEQVKRAVTTIIETIQIEYA